MPPRQSFLALRPGHDFKIMESSVCGCWVKTKRSSEEAKRGQGSGLGLAPGSRLWRGHSFSEVTQGIRHQDK